VNQWEIIFSLSKNSRKQVPWKCANPPDINWSVNNPSALYISLTYFSIRRGGWIGISALLAIFLRPFQKTSILNSDSFGSEAQCRKFTHIIYMIVKLCSWFTNGPICHSWVIESETLKGQCHEIFCFRFFPWIIFPQAPKNNIKIISIFFEK
jgi:hypothetical protein